MYYKNKVAWSLLFCGFSVLGTIQEKPIVIVIPSWNNVSLCHDNLASVFMQNYDNYRVMYIDDCSTDGTAQEVISYIQEQNQTHRCTVLVNAVRRGIMYNHYVAVHRCENNVIIVNLDGDDQFAHRDVLNRINEAYQDDTIWMTYGNYKEWPNKAWPDGKPGICRKIPYAIHHYHAYRYFDWVTSHLRTFYAGLFKAIPVGYFIHNHEFQPSAVDHAMMYSMLELSKGRVHFIDEVLYLYNCENPNNVFRTMILTDMAMGYISRGREPLEPLTYDPRIVIPPQNKQIRTAILCFSTSGAAKADKCLSLFARSPLGSEDMYLLYETDIDHERDMYQKLCDKYPKIYCIDVCAENGLKSVLSNFCTTKNYSHVLLISDSFAMSNAMQCTVPEMVRMLDKTHSVGFYITLGKNVQMDNLLTRESTQPPLVEIEQNFYVWKFSKALAAWRFPFTADGVLYATDVLHTCVQQCSFARYQEFQRGLHMLAPPRLDDTGLCYVNALYEAIS